MKKRGMILSARVFILLSVLVCTVANNAFALCGSYAQISTPNVTTNLTEGIVEKVLTKGNNSDVLVYLASAKQDGSPVSCVYTSVWASQVGTSDYIKLIRQSAFLAMTLNYYFEPMLVQSSFLGLGLAYFHETSGNIVVTKP